MNFFNYLSVLDDQAKAECSVLARRQDMTYDEFHNEIERISKAQMLRNAKNNPIKTSLILVVAVGLLIAAAILPFYLTKH